MITAGMLTGKALTENGDGITPGTQTIWRTPRLPAAGKLAQSSREIYGYEPGIQLFSREFLKKKKRSNFHYYINGFLQEVRKCSPSLES
ncbi:hypothetical protein NN561_018367 [Cricetulus griseus]